MVLLTASLFNFMEASATVNEIYHCNLVQDGRTVAKAKLKLSDDGSGLEYIIECHGIEDITMAHLHLGKPGKIGPPVAWLYPPSPPPRLIPGKLNGILAKGTITERDMRGPFKGKPFSFLINQINAENIYINIHTKAHAGGSICGPVHLTEQ